MRTLQASLYLSDGGDKVIFRQIGGESSLRTLQSGHTVLRADQFDSDGWQLPEITELCQDNIEGLVTNYMSAISQMHQRTGCMDDDTPAGDHDSTTTRSCRPRPKTTSHRMSTDVQDLTQIIYPRHHLGSRVVRQRTASNKTMSGIYGRALGATSPGETQRHGILWTVNQWKRLTHYMMYVQSAAFFDTLSRELLMLIPTGRSEDIRMALRRREQREMKNKESNAANFSRSSGCAAKLHREATREHRGRRRRTTAIIPRTRSRREATLQRTTNDAKCAGTGGSGSSWLLWHGI